MTTLERYIEKKLNIDARYFVRGGFWLTLTQALTIIFGLISTVLMANLLSEHDFGVYKYLLGLAAIFTSFSLTGLDIAILQATAKKYFSFYHESLKTSFLWSLNVLVICFGASGYYLLQGDMTLALGCAIIGITYPILRQHQFVPAFLQGAHQLRQNTIFQTLRAVTVTAALLAATILSGNVLIILLGYFSAQLVVNQIGYLYFVRPRRTIQTPPSEQRRFIRYAVHTSVRNLATNIAYRLDTVVVFTQLGSTQLAIYAIALIIPEQIKGAFKNIGALILRRYSTQPDYRRTNIEIIKRTVQLFVTFSGISIAFVFIIPYLHPILFPKYSEAVLYSQLLALSFPAAASLVPYSVMQANTHERALYEVNLVNAAVSTLLTIVLTLSFNVLGAVLAKVLSRYFNFITVSLRVIKL